MYTTYVENTSVGKVRLSDTPGGIKETDLEQTVGISLIADFNAQLSQLSSSMQEQLETKNSLRSDIGTLQAYSSRTTVKNSNGDDAVIVTASEKDALINAGYTGLSFEEKTDGTGYALSKSSLTSCISIKQEELAGINSNSELSMLQIQSLVDQRKNALMLLSNLLASKNESLAGIIRNLKN